MQDQMMQAKIPVIPDMDIPVEFRSETMFLAINAGTASRHVEDFKDWCNAHGVYYYAWPRGEFDPLEAEELAREAGSTRLLMDDLS